MKRKLLMYVLFIVVNAWNINNIYAQPKHSEFDEAPIELKSQEFQNIYAFTRLYGYIRYFYPGINSKKLDWGKYAIYGVRKVSTARDNNELTATLNEIFLPICPALTISSLPIVQAQVDSKHKKNEKFYYNEYAGSGTTPAKFPMTLLYRPFYKRTIKCKSSNSKPGNPDPSRFLEYQLDDNIYVSFPNAVYNGGIKSEHFKEFKKDVDTISIVTLILKPVKVSPNAQFRSHRLASIIISWNSLQHFYPYFDYLPKDIWGNALQIALNKASDDASRFAFNETLQAMLSCLSDCHSKVWMSAGVGVVGGVVTGYFAGAEAKIINDTLLISNTIHKYASDLPKGTIIDSVNKKPVSEYVQGKGKLVSASTIQSKNYKNAIHIFHNYMKNDSVIELSYIKPNNESGKVNITSNIRYGYVVNDTTPFIRLIKPGIYYINLSSVYGSMKVLKESIKQFSEKDAIIIDCRNPVLFNNRILSYLIDSTVYSADFMTPVTTFPDRCNVTYTKEHFKIKPGRRHVKSKIVFLADASIVSYGESIFDIIKYYKIGTIIGEPTAGTNGDVTKLNLPIFSIFYSGIKVINHNGTQHFGKGIAPDILVSPTVKGVRECRDEILEAAIDFCSKK